MSECDTDVFVMCLQIVTQLCLGGSRILKAALRGSSRKVRRSASSPHSFEVWVYKLGSACDLTWQSKDVHQHLLEVAIMMPLRSKVASTKEKRLRRTVVRRHPLTKAVV